MSEVDDVDAGGESACYAHLLCQRCGGVLDETHATTCPERVSVARAGEPRHGDPSPE